MYSTRKWEHSERADSERLIDFMDMILWQLPRTGYGAQYSVLTFVEFRTMNDGRKEGKNDCE